MSNEGESMMATQPAEAGENASPPASEGAPAAGQAAPAAGMAEAYEKVVAEKRDLYDRLLRKQAEMENFRKRTQREKEELRQVAAEDLIRTLLPTLDGFERALRHRDPHVPEAYYQGLELIYRDLREALGRAGLTEIETAGQVFDPHWHQAVETVEAPGRREHEIVDEMQRGYRLRGKLLRPAIVKVAVGDRSAPGQE